MDQLIHQIYKFHRSEIFLLKINKLIIRIKFYLIQLFLINLFRIIWKISIQSKILIIKTVKEKSENIFLKSL